MKFLISVNLPCFRGMPNLSTYAHFCDPKHDLSAPLTDPDTTVDVWICKGEEVTPDLMNQWLDQVRSYPKSMLVQDAAMIPRLKAYANGRVTQIAEFPQHTHGAMSEAELILREAEMLYARGRAQAGQAISRPPRHGHGQQLDVLLVGAGIMNLMTAELLASKGCRVRIVDAGPDPRLCEDWTRLGVTNGGGNARMFTHTEADNYNEKGSKIYQDMQSIFRKTVREGGWGVKRPQSFTPDELAWVDAFERIPVWLAQSFKEDIHQVNREAGELWKELLSKSPELFQNAELHEDIVRMYVEPMALEAAAKLNDQLGAMVKKPSLDDFLGENPGFRSAAESNHLAGGIKVEGFTVNIHPFADNLIQRISETGGEFLWNCPVKSIERNSSGEVTALQSSSGPLSADHYVLSPGIPQMELLQGTASEGLIHGVLGVWLQIPNLHPQVQHSIKIHRRGHLVEDINITVGKDVNTGEDVLMFGGGYGYVGLDQRPQPDSPELSALFAELEEVARIYFPEAYAVAKDQGSLFPGGKQKYCVRPFTPTGLGVYETIPAARGGRLIITGGNNTGGFAQAPAIARAVWQTLAGELDPVHVLFHPARGKLPRSVSYRSRLANVEGGAARQPPRVLVLCSDGPQHGYLRHGVDKCLSDYRCIVERDAGQVRQLVQKGRLYDALYMKYHGLRRYLTGHAQQRKDYFARLVPRDYTPRTPDLVVDNLNCRQVWDAVEKYHGLRRYLTGHAQQRKDYFARLVPRDYTPRTPDLVVDNLNCRQVWDAVDRDGHLTNLSNRTPRLGVRFEYGLFRFDSNRIGPPLIRFESNAATRDSLRIERALSRFDINRMPRLDRIRFEFDRTAG
ncbi:FAD dependent oxidoreductase, partial [Metarhizium majus ARSEF 297]